MHKRAIGLLLFSGLILGGLALNEDANATKITGPVINIADHALDVKNVKGSIYNKVPETGSGAKVVKKLSSVPGNVFIATQSVRVDNKFTYYYVISTNGKVRGWVWGDYMKKSAKYTIVQKDTLKTTPNIKNTFRIKSSGKGALWQNIPTTVVQAKKLSNLTNYKNQDFVVSETRKLSSGEKYFKLTSLNGKTIGWTWGGYIQESPYRVIYAPDSSGKTWQLRKVESKWDGMLNLAKSGGALWNHPYGTDINAKRVYELSNILNKDRFAKVQVLYKMTLKNGNNFFYVQTEDGNAGWTWGGYITPYNETIILETLKAELQQEVDDLEELGLNNLLISSKNAYDSLVEEVSELINKEDVTREELEAKKEEVKNFGESLTKEVEKVGYLNSNVKKLEDAKEDVLLSTKTNVIQPLLEEVASLLNNEEAKISDVDSLNTKIDEALATIKEEQEVVSSIRDSIEALESIPEGTIDGAMQEEIDSLITEANGLLEGTDTTIEGLNNISGRLSAIVEEALSASEAMQEALKEAMDSLKEVVELADGIWESGTGDETWAVFENILGESKALIENGSNNIVTINNMEKNLREAILALQDRSGLQEALETNGDIQFDNFGKAYWAKYQTAVANAKEVMEDLTARATDIDNATADLNRSVKNLINLSDLEVKLRDGLMDAMNDYRATYDLPAVETHSLAVQAAGTRAEEIEINYSHTRPNGGSGTDALKDLGFSGVAGENITKAENVDASYLNKDGSQGLLNTWIASPSHNSYLLATSVTKGGMGIHIKENSSGSLAVYAVYLGISMEF